LPLSQSSQCGAGWQWQRSLFFSAGRRISKRYEIGKGHEHEAQKSMNSSHVVLVSVLLLIAIVASVDILFFRNFFWERLMMNVGIVLVFGAFLLRLINR
jgi:hypothetical protein